MLRRVDVAFTICVTFLLVASGAAAIADGVQHERRDIAPPAMARSPMMLLRSHTTDDGVGTLRLAADAFDTLRASSGRVEVGGVVLPDETGVARERMLSLERFAVAVPGARIVVGDAERPVAFDPSRVVHLRGTIDGAANSRAYVAIVDFGASGVGVAGQFEMGGQRWVLGGIDGTGRGFGRGDLAIVPADVFGAPPLVNPCAADCCAAGASRADAPPEGGIASFGPNERRLVRMAVDSDFEFFSLFGDEEEAAAYVLTVVGAVSDIYLREFDAAVGVSFIRLWDTPEDLYNEPDPLYPLRAHWNDHMGHVERDVTHLFTGRRNLPYGGVAWVSALCTSNGYAVNGYLNGSFASSVDPAGGNWDLVVIAHELGHNCGTLHTHDYGIDNCGGGEVRRGGIMSYCHTVSGGVSNVDLGFDTLIRGYVKGYLAGTVCLWIDCDGNGVDDALDIMLGTHADANGDGIPDLCQDCNDNGILDPIEIAMGLATDLNGSGVPDECEPDCNGNGIPDSLDVGLGASTDANGNGVPDECETDCDSDGTMDWLQIINDMSLDIDRDGILDACQDCDADGVPDHIQLAGARHLWVSGQGSVLRQIHIRSGAPARDADTAAIGANAVLNDLLLAPDGVLLVTQGNANRVLALNPVDGAVLGERISATAGLVNPGTMLLLDGVPPTLLVTSTATGRVVEYDAVTGAFVRVVVASGGGVKDPFGLALHPDGTLLVSSLEGSVQRFELETGAYLGPFIPIGGGGLGVPRGLLTLPDGTILVASTGFSALLRYGPGGEFLGRFDIGGVTGGTWGLRDPWCMRLADDGQRILVTSRSGATSVHSYGWPSGLFLRSFYVLGMDVLGARGLVQLPRSPLDCDGNGMLDTCDIAAGRAVDRNGNGVPDQCEGLVFGDLDGDGAVDGVDVGLLLNAWGVCPGCAADLNGDGAVDNADLAMLLGEWSASASQ